MSNPITINFLTGQRGQGQAPPGSPVVTMANGNTYVQDAANPTNYYLLTGTTKFGGGMTWQFADTPLTYAELT